MHYILIYKLEENYMERRAQFRPEHLNMVHDLSKNRELLLAGALNDPADHAFFIFTGDAKEKAISFANADPYVKNGLISSWSVREWNTVAGSLIEPEQ
jgi:uncharacterized protein YciI